MEFNVLGSTWTFTTLDFKDDEYMLKKNLNGYCNYGKREIVIANLATIPGYEGEPYSSLEKIRKETIRHEVIHCYLFESGLKDSSLPVEAWAMNEEMIDWFAIQAPKIVATWTELQAM